MDQIIICKHCKGYGRTHYDVGTHKSEYKYKTCPECKGSGRLEETKHTKHEPFVPGPNKSHRRF